MLEKEPAAQVHLLNAGRVFDHAHPTDESTSGNADTGLEAVSREQPAFNESPVAAASPVVESASPVMALSRNLSVWPATGLFKIVSQISPTGGENLEDLALLDESDRQQWLLIVAIRRENTWIVYRKLFHEAR